jgi:hypothetical protein
MPLRPLGSKLGRALDVIGGNHPLESVKLARHGLLWIITSLAIDFSTSWMMMSILGPSSEGNPSQRLLFESPSYHTMALWLVNEWAWLVIALFPVGALVFLELKGRCGKGIAHGVIGRGAEFFSQWSFALAWPLSFYRLAMGAGSNVSGMLIVFGPYVSALGWLAEAAIVAVVLEWDALSVIFKEKGRKG